jgi:hypothetical protein
MAMTKRAVHLIYLALHLCLAPATLDSRTTTDSLCFMFRLPQRYLCENLENMASAGYILLSLSPCCFFSWHSWSLLRLHPTLKLFKIASFSKMVSRPTVPGTSTPSPTCATHRHRMLITNQPFLTPKLLFLRRCDEHLPVLLSGCGWGSGCNHNCNGANLHSP